MTDRTQPNSDVPEIDRLHYLLGLAQARISEFESNERAYEDRIKELEAQLEHALRQWLIC